MLRNRLLIASLAFVIGAQSVCAAELASAGPIAVATRPVSDSSGLQNSTAQDLYMVCAFYPKPGTCEKVYQQAMKDKSITAEAVRAEYNGYARYLDGSGSLTDADRQWLNNSGVHLPSDLTPANQAGLHNVINDPKIAAEARLTAVNNFLSRAVEAELYCGFNSCDAGAETTASASGAIAN